ncbi:hypothetical protein LADH09A_006217 [Micromonospora sp. LAH09]|uniref:hypothetical protein n=1 Tax=Micromonospora cabrerizensis TaxID=2911213 RepID=UPI001EE87AD6|nr:hypothetical protein [Micromonospora cabrerizensis]MCG5472181.1 hypothetical protein [Micromonospora cabrerizensis]
MKAGTRIGLAVGFGYLLGRRRKLRTALTLAAAVAAGRASRDPGGLLKRGTDALHSSPQLSNLGRLGVPLVNAGRAAATAAAGSGVDALTGRLRGSADALRRRSGTQSGSADNSSADNSSDGNGSDGNGGGGATNDRGDSTAGQRRGR